MRCNKNVDPGFFFIQQKTILKKIIIFFDILIKIWKILKREKLFCKFLSSKINTQINLLQDPRNLNEAYIYEN